MKTVERRLFQPSENDLPWVYGALAASIAALIAAVLLRMYFNRQRKSESDPSWHRSSNDYPQEIRVTGNREQENQSCASSTDAFESILNDAAVMNNDEFEEILLHSQSNTDRNKLAEV